MEETCRCCLAQGVHKDLNTKYIWLDKHEIYSTMLQECFNITLSPQCVSRSICEVCVKTLRAAFYFRQQVIQSEEVLLTRATTSDVPLSLVKVEQFDSDSDDYFLADAARRVKQEPSIAGDEWLDNTINQLPEVTIRKKTQPKKEKMPKVRIKRDNKKIKWIGPNRIETDLKRQKEKHRENFVNILKFSNATPFKKKSLLGYTCAYCEKLHPDPMDLRSHTQTEHSKERLNLLNSRFDMTEYYVHLDVNNLICTLCNENMQDLTIFKTHLVKLHKKIIHNDIKDHLIQFKLKKGAKYDCAMCSCTYETFKMLKQHMNKHYNNYSCVICEATFATKRSLNAHKATHESGSFKCEQCDKVFSSKVKKNYHQKRKHFGAKHISNCPYCNESFRNYYQRNQHMIKIHNTEAQYKCNVCSKSYILKSLLMSHIKKNHLMERNYQCTECGYRFFSKKALKAHMVKHSGEKLYSCEVCHKAYARKYTLREHMRIHNDDRRFRCQVCSTCFVQKCSLKNHLLSNHGITMAASEIPTLS